MATDETEKIEALEKRLESLSEELAQYRAELRAARAGSDLSMRKQRRCPSCGDRKILFAKEILDGDQGRSPMAVAQPSIWSGKRIGLFQGYFCGSCGLVEWYIKDVKSFPVDGKTVVLLEENTPDPEGAYR
jgi:hypothetical protein